MARAHGRTTRLLVNEFDLSEYFANSEVLASAALSDRTGYQETAVRRIVGLLSGELSADGFYDGATDAVDSVLNAALVASAEQLAVHAPEDMAVGARLKLLSFRQENHKVTAVIADTVKIGMKLLADSHGVRAGVSLHAVSGETATFNGASVDNAASSANGAIGHLHVPANTRNGNTTVKIQHSPDNSAWADLITFTVVGSSTKTSERKTVTGTVDRYVRAIATLAGSTGSITPAVAFARL